MAKKEISKVKLPGSDETVYIKDEDGRADFATLLGGATLTALGGAAWKDVASTVTSGGADLPTAGAVYTAIDDEATRAKGVEGGLDTRIQNLEARGRFLSGWNVGTGKPSDYPTVPSGATYPYDYVYKAGDYYIVSAVPASGDKYQPSGTKITKPSASEAWTVGTAAETREVAIGDYYVYSTTGWILVSNSQKTVSFENIAGDADDNVNLKGKLDELRNGKLSKDATVAGVAFSGTVPNVDTTALQTALGLEDLAYANTASGAYTPAGSIDAITVVNGGSITLNDFTQTETAATITAKADYTPAGSIKVDDAAGTVLKGGSISVTVKDAASATAVTDLEFEAYTPSGAISAATTDGSFSAIKTAAFAETDATTGVQIEGTVSAPTLNVSSSTQSVITAVSSTGTVPSFTDGKIGTFTAPSLGDDFFKAGSAATWTGATYAAPSLTAAATNSFATKVLKAVADTTGCLIFSYADASDTGLTSNFASAVTDRGTFTAGSVDFGAFTANVPAEVDVTKFNAGSWTQGTFNAGAMPTFSGATLTLVSDVTADAPTFTGKRYTLNTTSDTALKNVVFAGTSANVKLSGAKYLKQEISTATFTGTAATLTFAGATASQLIPTEVKYDKATANGASFNVATTSITPEFHGTSATITVTPDAE